MTEKTIEAAREALQQVKGFIEYATGAPGDIMAWYRLKNFIDLAEREMQTGAQTE